MKKKLIIGLALFLTITTLATGCSFGDDGYVDVLPNEDGLLVFKNPKQAKAPYNGGGYDVNPSNTSDATLKYNYDGLGEHIAIGGVDYMPSTGNVNLLVIPVKLADYPYDATEEKRQDIYHAYFGTEEDTGFESVSTYFDKTSYGSLEISGVVTEWYETEYTTKIGCTGANPRGSADVADLVGDAFEWYKRTYNSTGSEFDSDKDGYVDAICLIYNAPTHVYRNDDQLWAYCFWRGQQPGTVRKPKVNAFFWASQEFMDYPSQSPFGKRIIDAHTYIHELGHVMGLDDYYNYANNRDSSTGGYIMQDMNIGDHDPFSKMSLGWVTPTLVTGSTTLELKSFTDSGQVLIFKSNMNDFESPFDEYIAVELYTPTGLNEFDSKNKYDRPYPQGPNVPGLRIWHIDGRLLEYSRVAGQMNPTVRVTNKYQYPNSYILAMSNTNSGEYASVVPEFRKFKLLHCLQAGGVNTYTHGGKITSNDLFKAGSSFSMSNYSSFFVNPGLFNDGSKLDFELKVESIKNNVANIRIVM